MSEEARRADLLQAAFRDVHAARLHGFALLVTLGDEATSAAAAAQVMAEAQRRLPEMRHPERSAAWLRARLVSVLQRTKGRAPASSEEHRREALAILGTPAVVYDALATLSVQERIALVAGQIEGLDPLDVATILGRSISDANDLLAAARAAYLSAALAAMSRPGQEVEPPAGQIAVRVLSDAARTLGDPARPA